MKAVTYVDWNWIREVVRVPQTLAEETYACQVVLVEELALELMLLLPEIIVMLCCYCKLHMKIYKLPVKDKEII